MSWESFTVSQADGVADVVLVGPGKGNALGPAFFRELPELFRQLDEDDAVRAVVVSGKGGVFSYGLDLPAMMPSLMPLLEPNVLARERTQLLKLIRAMQSGFDWVERCSKPVIAAIAGPCIGAGVDLAAACDIRLCAQNAKFSVREVKVAIVADMGSLQRLPRIIGEGQTRELAFTGRDIDGTRAEKIGLVNDVFADEAALLAAARKMAHEIAQNPPLVVQGVKHVMNYDGDREHFVATWNAAFLASKDLGEAMAAFMERRPPKFTGT